MKPTRLATLVLTCAGILTTTQISHAEDKQKFEVVIPKGDKISIRVPNQWTHKIIQPDPSLPPTVKIASPTDSVTILITFLPDRNGLFSTKESVDRAATNANQHYVQGSVEKKNDLIQLESKFIRGCYATFTDAEAANAAVPKKGEFTKVTSGVFVIRKQGAVFTLLSNDTKSADFKLALQTITEHITNP